MYASNCDLIFAELIGVEPIARYALGGFPDDDPKYFLYEYVYVMGQNEQKTIICTELMQESEGRVEGLKTYMITQERKDEILQLEVETDEDPKEVSTL
jgi:hypothetical protein